MREILFRGKTEKREWVYGAYSHYDDVKDNGKDDCDYIIEKHNGEYFPFREVIPETVGQFTGLTDKNGKKIFEGDIVSIDGKNYEVKYLLGQFFVGINMPIAYKRFDCEVIGNIHDNHELLEGKTNE